MSEYKKDTVGWHLDTLKEPLKSRALALYEGLPEHWREDFIDAPAADGKMYLARIFARIDGYLAHNRSKDRMFWCGVYEFFSEQLHRNGTFSRESGTKMFKEGWDMAEECAPDSGESVLVPSNPENPMAGLFTSAPKARVLDEADFPPRESLPTAVTTGIHENGEYDDPRIAKLEQRIALLEDTLAAFIQFVNENLCDNGEFTH